MSEKRFSSPDLRVILLGNIGCGKTSSADTILGQLSHISSGASKSCQLRQGLSEGRNMTLVEAPRWYWNGGKMEDGVRKETARALTLVSPGPHVVLLLVPVSQFTEMESRVPTELQSLFGREVLDHTLVLLTCGDYLMGKTAEEYLQTEHPGLRQMIECCGGRYHVLNNRRRQDREQVHELLKKVDSMVLENGPYIIKTDEEKELEKRVKERTHELMESYRAQKQETTASRSFDVVDKVEEPVLEKMRGEGRDELERKVGAIQVSNGLSLAPAPEPKSYSQPNAKQLLNRTPSYRLNADGAILSQMSEVKSTPKVTSTFHHRINSFEDKTPESSPTSAPLSPAFSPPSHSLPNLDASSSLLSPPSSSTSSSTSLPSSAPELRLVLLGRSGAGKSAAGNSILGQEAFMSSSDGFTAITQKCEKKKALVEGKRVAVIDTPDWFNSEQTPDEVRAQISSCVALSSPGPHAFLLCVPLDQPAKTELQALRALETVFGPEAVQRHTIVLFTHADRLRESGKAVNGSVEGYISTQRGDLLKLVEKCRDRFHVMERGEGRGEKRNVAELLETVEQTIKEAGGQCYSCPAFQEAESKVRQKQLEISRERRGERPEQDTMGDTRRLSSERVYMQTVDEAEEDLKEEEIERTRDEAEMSVSAINLDSLPPITRSTMSPSLLQSIMEKVESSAKMLPKLLADSSALVGEGAKKMQSSPVWGKVGSGAQNVQKIVVDSSVWQKVGATAGQVSKAVGDRVPKVVVDGSAWVGSGAKAVAASPVWGKVGSGAKSGAKLVADSSVRAGAGIGTGAKKVAQSPVWGKVSSGAKAGAKMVAESSVWEKIGAYAKQVPKVVIGGAILGLVLGVFLGGVIGGAVGAAAGSAVTEVGRRKLNSKGTAENTDETARNVQGMVNSVGETMKGGGKSLKTE
ncbi:unnamed protein product [Menidia menidia]|uniref:(Atlantic silverside) hypothetical protein n=1 Tax=Menidia menidia TaxID=238744 RepID=A0A8S4BFE7_9TELE|nr:unnamed protein product [Menidia menidia]